MNKYRGSKAEANKKSIKDTLIEKFSLRAYAEEPKNPEDDDEGGNPNPSSTLDFEDLISKARKEEKDKHYKTISKLKDKVDTFTKQHNDDLLVIAGLQNDLAKANEKLSKPNEGESEQVKKLKEQISDLTAQINTLTTENEEFKNTPPVNREDVVAEVRAELEAEYEVKTYKVTKLAEHKDDLLVPELVFGNTKEEIDDSLQKALNRSKEIREALGVNIKKKKTYTANPSVNDVQDSNVSVEQLANMDVSSKEYAELRKQLGLR